MTIDDFPETEIYKSMALRYLPCREDSNDPWELIIRWESNSSRVCSDNKTFSYSSYGASPNDALDNLRIELAMQAQQYIDLAKHLGWLGGYNIK